MPQAGFCEECKASVLLTPDGGCPQGHAPASISSTWVAPGGDVPADSPRKRRMPVWLVMILVSAVVIVVALVAGGFVLTRMFADSSVPAQWRERIATDYPGWRVTGYLSFPVDDSDDPPETDYVLDVVPPGESFSLGVMYEAHQSNPPYSDDQVLRPAGSRHVLAPSLLAFLKSEYIDKGKAVDFVTPGYDGDASVSWLPEGASADTVGTIDEVSYDESTHKWAKY